MHLFTNRTQMIKCGENKEVVHEEIAECATAWCSYHILTSSFFYYWTEVPQHGIYLFHTAKKHKRATMMSSIHMSPIAHSKKYIKHTWICWQFLVFLDILLSNNQSDPCNLPFPVFLHSGVLQDLLIKQEDIHYMKLCCLLVALAQWPNGLNKRGG